MPTPPIPQTIMQAAGGAVSVEFVVNSPVWASYRIDLLSRERKLVRNIGMGYNYDNVPDRFTLVETVAQLAGSHIAFTSVVAPYTKGQAQPYTVMLVVTQAATGALTGGIVQDTGTAAEPKYAVGITQLAIG